MDIGQVLVGIGLGLISIERAAKGLKAADPQWRKAERVVVRDASGRTLTAVYENIRTLDQRVARIVRLVRRGAKDPRVRRFALQVLGKRCGEDWCVRERDYWGEVVAIFDTVRQGVRYVRDQAGCDTFQAAGNTIEWKGGDCDDYAILLGSILQSVGYPVALRVVKTKGATEWNHIYLMVGLPPSAPTEWRALDASVPEPAGWEVPAGDLDEWCDYEVAA
jgi:hypothetical protein